MSWRRYILKKNFFNYHLLYVCHLFVKGLGHSLLGPLGRGLFEPCPAVAQGVHTLFVTPPRVAQMEGRTTPSPSVHTAYPLAELLLLACWRGKSKGYRIVKWFADNCPPPLSPKLPQGYNLNFPLGHTSLLPRGRTPLPGNIHHFSLGDKHYFSPGTFITSPYLELCCKGQVPFRGVLGEYCVRGGTPVLAGRLTRTENMGEEYEITFKITPRGMDFPLPRGQTPAPYKMRFPCHTE